MSFKYIFLTLFGKGFRDRIVKENKRGHGIFLGGDSRHVDWYGDGYRLGIPWPDNPYVESFNGKFRDECLSMNWFMDLEDAGEKIEEYRVDYNTIRPTHPSSI